MFASSRLLRGRAQGLLKTYCGRYLKTKAASCLGISQDSVIRPTFANTRECIRSRLSSSLRHFEWYEAMSMNTLSLTRDTNHLYNISGSSCDYYTGEVASGLQVMIVISSPCFVCVFFNRLGELVATEEYPLSASTQYAAKRHGGGNCLQSKMRSWSSG